MRLGLHVSSAGKVYQSLDRAHVMGCETMQIFVGNPRGWKETLYDPADIEAFRKRRAELGIDPVVVHASYLINLPGANSDFRHRSVDKLLQTVRIAREIEASNVVFHIGTHQGDGKQTGFDRLKSALALVLDNTENVRLALEPSAGGINHLGWKIEELGELLDHLGDDPRLAVCLDTAHLFASGFDIREPSVLEKLLDDIEQYVSLSRVSVLHLNDCKSELGSFLDRHDNIGEGKLGLPTFRRIINHPKLTHLPGIMETPGFDSPESNGRNIEVMRSLREQS